MNLYQSIYDKWKDLGIGTHVTQSIQNYHDMKVCAESE